MTPSSTGVGCGKSAGVRLTSVALTNTAENNGSIPPPGSAGPTVIAVVSHCGPPGCAS